MLFVANVCLASYYVIMGAGVYACWRAYRHRRNRAWLLLAIYCFLPFILYGCRVTGRVLYGPELRKVAARQEELVAGHRVIPEQRIDIKLPIGPVILVIALWSLAKKELEEEAIQPALHGEEDGGPPGD